MEEIAFSLASPAAQLDVGTREQAFAALAERHAAFLYKVAYGLLRHRQDAEDTVQETLLKLYRSDSWLAMKDEKAFLATAVWRMGLERLGSAGAKAMRQAEDVNEMKLASNDHTPETHAIEADERQVMRRLIEALPEGFRQALVLSAIDGMRSHEVAAVLGISEVTVRTRVLRAKAELRQSFLALTAAPKEVRP